MRETNFEMGRMNPGYNTNYANQYKDGITDSYERTIIGKAEKNKLESSHWDHSRSWS